ncbi:AP2 domain transcription factor AP2XII-4 [Besnoitia besnoiti]|uniref:AP2 domain transcription factor AP2XII-4 n=1 Tax=Besnoitia besnoiti TaxID=94643 RepID=A0A2A9MQ03_BESBE|nr:AP2 domain transcription factor AP2XII-4 [Besnoitia besnoiti]PFH38207.1 AP2 domain transcription factor AP2XII-4 [Besnoitia besnoiti]
MSPFIPRTSPRLSVAGAGPPPEGGGSAQRLGASVSLPPLPVRTHGPPERDSAPSSSSVSGSSTAGFRRTVRGRSTSATASPSVLSRSASPRVPSRPSSSASASAAAASAAERGLSPAGVRRSARTNPRAALPDAKLSTGIVKLQDSGVQLALSAPRGTAEPEGSSPVPPPSSHSRARAHPAATPGTGPPSSSGRHDGERLLPGSPASSSSGSSASFSSSASSSSSRFSPVSSVISVPSASPSLPTAPAAAEAPSDLRQRQPVATRDKEQRTSASEAHEAADSSSARPLESGLDTGTSRREEADVDPANAGSCAASALPEPASPSPAEAEGLPEKPVCATEADRARLEPRRASVAPSATPSSPSLVPPVQSSSPSPLSSAPLPQAVSNGAAPLPAPAPAPAPVKRLGRPPSRSPLPARSAKRVKALSSSSLPPASSARFFVPCQCQFNAEKGEWRARYLWRGEKKMRVFSLARHSPDVAVALAELFLTHLATYDNLPRAEVVAQWAEALRAHFASQRERDSLGDKARAEDAGAPAGPPETGAPREVGAVKPGAQETTGTADSQKEDGDKNPSLHTAAAPAQAVLSASEPGVRTGAGAPQPSSSPPFVPAAVPAAGLGGVAPSAAASYVSALLQAAQARQWVAETSHAQAAAFVAAFPSGPLVRAGRAPRPIVPTLASSRARRSTTRQLAAGVSDQRPSAAAAPGRGSTAPPGAKDVSGDAGEEAARKPSGLVEGRGKSVAFAATSPAGKGKLLGRRPNRDRGDAEEPRQDRRGRPPLLRDGESKTNLRRKGEDTTSESRERRRGREATSSRGSIRSSSPSSCSSSASGRGAEHEEDDNQGRSAAPRVSLAQPDADGRRSRVAFAGDAHAYAFAEKAVEGERQGRALATPSSASSPPPPSRWAHTGDSRDADFADTGSCPGVSSRPVPGVSGGALVNGTAAVGSIGGGLTEGWSERRRYKKKHGGKGRSRRLGTLSSPSVRGSPRQSAFFPAVREHELGIAASSPLASPLNRAEVGGYTPASLTGGAGWRAAAASPSAHVLSSPFFPSWSSSASSPLHAPGERGAVSGAAPSPASYFTAQLRRSFVQGAGVPLLHPPAAGAQLVTPAYSPSASSPSLCRPGLHAGWRGAGGSATSERVGLGQTRCPSGSSQAAEGESKVFCPLAASLASSSHEYRWYAHPDGGSTGSACCRRHVGGAGGGGWPLVWLKQLEMAFNGKQRFSSCVEGVDQQLRFGGVRRHVVALQPHAGTSPSATAVGSGTPNGLLTQRAKNEKDDSWGLVPCVDEGEQARRGPASSWLDNSGKEEGRQTKDLDSDGEHKVMTPVHRGDAASEEDKSGLSPPKADCPASGSGGATDPALSAGSVAPAKGEQGGGTEQERMAAEGESREDAPGDIGRPCPHQAATAASPSTREDMQEEKETPDAAPSPSSFHSPSSSDGCKASGPHRDEKTAEGRGEKESGYLESFKTRAGGKADDASELEKDAPTLLPTGGGSVTVSALDLLSSAVHTPRWQASGAELSDFSDQKRAKGGASLQSSSQVALEFDARLEGPADALPILRPDEDGSEKTKVSEKGDTGEPASAEGRGSAADDSGKGTHEKRVVVGGGGGETDGETQKCSGRYPGGETAAGSPRRVREGAEGTRASEVEDAHERGTESTISSERRETKQSTEAERARIEEAANQGGSEHSQGGVTPSPFLPALRRLAADQGREQDEQPSRSPRSSASPSPAAAPHSSSTRSSAAAPAVSTALQSVAESVALSPLCFGSLPSGAPTAAQPSPHGLLRCSPSPPQKRVAFCLPRGGGAPAAIERPLSSAVPYPLNARLAELVKEFRALQGVATFRGRKASAPVGPAPVPPSPQGTNTATKETEKEGRQFEEETADGEKDSASAAVRDDLAAVSTQRGGDASSEKPREQEKRGLDAEADDDSKEAAAARPATGLSPASSTPNAAAAPATASTATGGAASVAWQKVAPPRSSDVPMPESGDTPYRLTHPVMSRRDMAVRLYCWLEQGEPLGALGEKRDRPADGLGSGGTRESEGKEDGGSLRVDTVPFINRWRHMLQRALSAASHLRQLNLQVVQLVELSEALHVAVHICKEVRKRMRAGSASESEAEASGDAAEAAGSNAAATPHAVSVVSSPGTSGPGATALDGEAATSIGDLSADGALSVKSVAQQGDAVEKPEENEGGMANQVPGRDGGQQSSAGESDSRPIVVSTGDGEAARAESGPLQVDTEAPEEESKRSEEGAMPSQRADEARVRAGESSQTSPASSSSAILQPGDLRPLCNAARRPIRSPSLPPLIGVSGRGPLGLASPSSSSFSVSSSPSSALSCSPASRFPLALSLRLASPSPVASLSVASSPVSLQRLQPPQSAPGSSPCAASLLGGSALQPGADVLRATVRAALRQSQALGVGQKLAEANQQLAARVTVAVRAAALAKGEQRLVNSDIGILIEETQRFVREEQRKRSEAEGDVDDNGDAKDGRDSHLAFTPVAHAHNAGAPDPLPPQEEGKASLAFASSASGDLKGEKTETAANHEDDTRLLAVLNAFHRHTETLMEERERLIATTNHDLTVLLQAMELALPSGLDGPLMSILEGDVDVLPPPPTPNVEALIYLHASSLAAADAVSSPSSPCSLGYTGSLASPSSHRFLTSFSPTAAGFAGGEAARFFSDALAKGRASSYLLGRASEHERRRFGETADRPGPVLPVRRGRPPSAARLAALRRMNAAREAKAGDAGAFLDSAGGRSLKKRLRGMSQEGEEIQQAATVPFALGRDLHRPPRLVSPTEDELSSPRARALSTASQLYSPKRLRSGTYAESRDPNRKSLRTLFGRSSYGHRDALASARSSPHVRLGSGGRLCVEDGSPSALAAGLYRSSRRQSELSQRGGREMYSPYAYSYSPTARLGRSRSRRVRLAADGGEGLEGPLRLRQAEPLERRRGRGGEAGLEERGERGRSRLGPRYIPNKVRDPATGRVAVCAYDLEHGERVRKVQLFEKEGVGALWCVRYGPSDEFVRCFSIEKMGSLKALVAAVLFRQYVTGHPLGYGVGSSVPVEKIRASAFASGLAKRAGPSPRHERCADEDANAVEGAGSSRSFEESETARSETNEEQNGGQGDTRGDGGAGWRAAGGARTEGRGEGAYDEERAAGKAEAAEGLARLRDSDTTQVPRTSPRLRAEETDADAQASSLASTEGGTHGATAPPFPQDASDSRAHTTAGRDGQLGGVAPPASVDALADPAERLALHSLGGGPGWGTQAGAGSSPTAFSSLGASASVDGGEEGFSASLRVASSPFASSSLAPSSPQSSLPASPAAAFASSVCSSRLGVARRGSVSSLDEEACEEALLEFGEDFSGSEESDAFLFLDTSSARGFAGAVRHYVTPTAGSASPTSGGLGIHYDKTKHRWKATWTTPDGQRASTSFSVKVLGMERARELALEARQRALAGLDPREVRDEMVAGGVAKGDREGREEDREEDEGRERQRRRMEREVKTEEKEREERDVREDQGRRRKPREGAAGGEREGGYSGGVGDELRDRQRRRKKCDEGRRVKTELWRLREIRQDGAFALKSVRGQKTLGDVDSRGGPEERKREARMGRREEGEDDEGEALDAPSPPEAHRDDEGERARRRKRRQELLDEREGFRGATSARRASLDDDARGQRDEKARGGSVEGDRNVRGLRGAASASSSALLLQVAAVRSGDARSLAARSASPLGGAGTPSRSVLSVLEKSCSALRAADRPGSGKRVSSPFALSPVLSLPRSTRGAGEEEDDIAVPRTPDDSCESDGEKLEALTQAHKRRMSPLSSLLPRSARLREAQLQRRGEAEGDRDVSLPAVAFATSSTFAGAQGEGVSGRVKRDREAGGRSGRSLRASPTQRPLTRAGDEEKRLLKRHHHDESAAAGGFPSSSSTSHASLASSSAGGLSGGRAVEREREERVRRYPPARVHTPVDFSAESLSKLQELVGWDCEIELDDTDESVLKAVSALPGPRPRPRYV